uniref:Tryptophan-associated membrane protein n=1 Tax=Nonomuraea gerenzanensis TaxID=93944 RepID=A0A1M4E7A2_9ACTN|nr:Tryptophan-associated membrane protein [Nonomuraea gerenzanensis]
MWVAATALGCLAVLVAAGQGWATVLQGAEVEAPTGGDLAPALTPVALAGLAGVVAVLATKGLGRRLVGALLALCGAGAAAATWTALSGDHVATWLREQNVLRGAAEVPWEAAPLWPVVAAAGAVLMVAGGVVAIVRGGRWAGMSARYDRGAGAGSAAGTGAGSEAKAQVSDDRALWDALDRGDDPTDSR